MGRRPWEVGLGSGGQGQLAFTELLLSVRLYWLQHVVFHISQHDSEIMSILPLGKLRLRHDGWWGGGSHRGRAHSWGGIHLPAQMSESGCSHCPRLCIIKEPALQAPAPAVDPPLHCSSPLLRPTAPPLRDQVPRTPPSVLSLQEVSHPPVWRKTELGVECGLLFFLPLSLGWFSSGKSGKPSSK